MANEKSLVIFITGASRGIGACLAAGLATAGHQVALMARNTEQLEALSTEINQPEHTLGLPGDVTCQADIDDAVQKTLERFGRIDVLINNAGIAHQVGAFETVDIDELVKTVDVNLNAVMRVTHSVLNQAMLKQNTGLIINIKSNCGHKAYSHWSGYVASKFGLKGWAQVLGAELRDKGIRVSSLFPGGVDTGIWDATDTGMSKKERQDAVASEHMLSPQAILNAVCYLIAQPGSVYIPELLIEPLRPGF